MTGLRLPKTRWLAAGGVTLLAAGLGVALLLQNGGSACAAPPSTSVHKGVATYFFLDGTLGNCSYPRPPADGLFVALGPSQYASGASCGTYLDVTGPRGKVRVKVIDSCPECPVGHLDLSLTAFKKIARQVDGLVPISYRAVPGAAVPARISVRVKEGSSRYWLSLLIDNHANRLASVQVAGPGAAFRKAHREAWNYWTLPSGAGKGPFKVKITDVYGHTVTIPGVTLSLGTTQKTSATLSGAPVGKSPQTGKRAAEAASTASHPSASRSVSSPGTRELELTPAAGATTVPATPAVAVAEQGGEGTGAERLAEVSSSCG